MGVFNGQNKEFKLQPQSLSARLKYAQRTARGWTNGHLAAAFRTRHPSTAEIAVERRGGSA
jgi:hypothetical protein